MPGVCRDQKDMLNPLELELRVVGPTDLMKTTDISGYLLRLLAVLHKVVVRPNY